MAKQRTRRRRGRATSSLVPSGRATSSLVPSGRAPKFVAASCSLAGKKSRLNDGTCYSAKTLLQLREMYNQKFPGRPIQSTDPHEIYAALRRSFAGKCHRETCFVKMLSSDRHVRGKMLEEFAPPAPSEWADNPQAWLSSDDLQRAGRQMQNAHPEFLFLGPSPSDYDFMLSKTECVWPELCKFQLADAIRDGKTKIGCVFNIDTHELDGSHWTALYIDVKKRSIFYFDSTGDPIPKNILRFVKTVQKQAAALGTPYSFDSNAGVEHQFGDTECGIYSIYFLRSLLTGKMTGGHLKSHVIRDREMQKFRGVYFNLPDRKTRNRRKR